jgi:ORF6N domain
MLDTDLSRLHGVETFRLNEAIKRNADRFPEDFCFRINHEEVESLTSQIAMSKIGRGGRRTLPWAFTEHDDALRAFWHQLQPLLQPPPERPNRRIGFLS